MNLFSLDKIKAEYRHLTQHPLASFGFTLGLEKDGDFKNWKFTLCPPNDCLYKGGIYCLTAHFPDNYPLSPPEICFETPIYHLNVNPFVPKNLGDDKLGLICINPLGLWKNDYSMTELILNVFSLFYYENPYYAYGPERAQEYKNNRVIYEEKVKLFTRRYADPRHQVALDYKNKTHDWDFNYNLF